LAICQALAKHFDVPCNRDGLRDQIQATLQRQSQLNLINLGQLLSNLSLGVMLTEVPVQQIARVPTPAVLQHNGNFALLDGVDPDGQLRLLEPELGPLRLPLRALLEPDQTELALLLLQRRPDSKQARFSWSWFGPFLAPHKRELGEVLLASAITNTLALATPLGMQRLIDANMSDGASLNGLLSIGLLLLLATLVKAVVGGLRSLIFTGLTNRVDMATKASILDQLVRLPQGFFDSRPVGQVMFYFTQLDRLRDFLIGQSLPTIVDFGFSLLYIAVLFVLNPLLTWVTLSTLPLFLLLGLVSTPLVDRQVERVVAAGVRTYSYLNEAISGIQTIKSQNAELKTRWEFQNRYAHLIGEDFKFRVTGETISKLAEFINELNGLLVICVGLYLVYQNKLSLGGFIAFRIISGYITGPLVKLVQTWQQFKIASQNLQLVGDIVDRQTEQSDAQATNIPMPPLQGEVSFQGVHFRYTPEGDRILHSVSLEIPCGSFVGMVGGSGSGKSTLLKLLPRFYEPEKGRVLIDRLDVAKVELYSLRRQIGVVPQDSLLFDGTIRENLLLVKPDASAEELIRACKIACAHDFIMNLPQGYNSSVGERGAGLSGGQRQRMALARAVLQNPRMLILDEATSALDARTERQVCLNLFEAFRGRTVFFITHRLSTVRPADLIVLMDEGAVMEVGSHKQLMQQQGWYYALYQSQAEEN
jgi:ATP-binding cassette subfamily B protein